VIDEKSFICSPSSHQITSKMKLATIIGLMATAFLTGYGISATETMTVSAVTINTQSAHGPIITEEHRFRLTTLAVLVVSTIIGLFGAHYLIAAWCRNVMSMKYLASLVSAFALWASIIIGILSLGNQWPSKDERSLAGTYQGLRVSIYLSIISMASLVISTFIHYEEQQEDKNA